MNADDLAQVLQQRPAGAALPPERLSALASILADEEAPAPDRDDALAALVVASAPALRAALTAHWRASRARGRGVTDLDREDAHAAVLVAVWEAARRFRHDGGSWYAAARMSAVKALGEVRTDWPPIHIPEYAARLYWRAMGRAGWDLMVALQAANEPTSALTPQRLLQVHYAMSGTVELHDAAGDEEVETPREASRHVASDAVRAVAALAGDENDWSPRELTVAWVRCRDADTASWEAVGAEVGVSRSAAHRDWVAALGKARRRLGVDSTPPE